MSQKQNARLLKKTKEYIRSAFRKKKARALLFHNMAHAEWVVKLSDKIAKKYSLDAVDRLVLLLSAWFYNSGYLTRTIDHKKFGAERAEKFLKKRRVRNDIIKRVMATIESSTVKQLPDGLLAHILADADRSYLGKKKFIKKNNLLRKEHEWLENKKISKETWNRQIVELMQSHSFHTGYAQDRLTRGVKDNLDKLMATLPQTPQQLVKVKPFI